MRFLSSQKIKTLIRSSVSIFFVCTIVLGGLGVSPKKAEALDIVFDPENFAENLATKALTAAELALEQSLNIKEFTLDGIAFGIAKTILQQNVKTLVNWINSGFEGSPMFITDLEQYLLDAADKAAGDFISGTELGFICEPFQADIKFVLNLEYQQARDFAQEASCTLSGSAENVENFYNGVASGGWQQWFEVVQSPQNNPYGAYMLGRAELRQRVEAAEENATTKADWGDGFLSVEDCSSGTCVTVTPGSLIADELSFSLTIGDRTLIEADEINEIISALFSQLMNQVMTGIGGLTGVSQSAGGGAPSYLDQIGNPTYDNSPDSGTGADVQTSFLTEAIKNETDYKNAYQGIVTGLQQVEQRVAPYVCSTASSTASSARSLRLELEAEINTVNTNISQIEALQDRYAATTSSSARMAIVNEYETLKAGGTLHDTLDVVSLDQNLQDERQELQTLRNRASTVESTCKTAAQIAAEEAAAQNSGGSGGSGNNNGGGGGNN